MPVIAAPLPYIPPTPQLPDMSYVRNLVDTSLTTELYASLSNIGASMAELQKNILATNQQTLGLQPEITSLQSNIASTNESIYGASTTLNEKRQEISRQDMKIFDKNRNIYELEDVLSGLKDTVPELDMRLESLTASSTVSAYPNKPVLNSKIRTGIMSIAGLQGLGGDEDTLGGLN